MMDVMTTRNETSQDNKSRISVQDLIDLGDRALGLKVVVISNKHSTHGVISYVLPDCQRLALEKASNPTNGKIHPGFVIYFFCEITSIIIVGEDTETRKALLKLVHRDDNVGRRVMVKKLVQPHLSDNDMLLDEDILLGKADPPLQSHSPLPPPPLGITRPADYIIIDQLDQTFHDAIASLMKEECIGLSVRGQDIGRFGSLAWINFATQSKAYFFDIGKLSGKVALKNGIVDILTSPVIVKVMHDSRFLVDFLHYSCDLSMKKVFDTQAVSVYLHMMNHRGTVPSFLSGLPNMLVKYIKLNISQIFFTHIREECQEDDEMMWFQRPLPERLLKEIFQSVMFLIELRKILLDLALVDLNQVNNLFISSIKDQGSATYKSIEPQIVPKEVQRLVKHSILNHVDLCDPYITYSRDTMRVIKK